MQFLTFSTSSLGKSCLKPSKNIFELNTSNYLTVWEHNQNDALGQPRERGKKGVRLRFFEALGQSQQKAHCPTLTRRLGAQAVKKANTPKRQRGDDELECVQPFCFVFLLDVQIWHRYFQPKKSGAVAARTPSQLSIHMATLCFVTELTARNLLPLSDLQSLEPPKSISTL